jgi:hypothetical protein
MRQFDDGHGGGLAIKIRLPHFSKTCVPLQATANPAGEMIDDMGMRKEAILRSTNAVSSSFVVLIIDRVT